MSTWSRRDIQFSWRDPVGTKAFRSGVSLHSHTMYSEESLTFVENYLRFVPALGKAKEAFRSAGFEEHAFWTPPLSPRQAHRLEQKQIERQFELPALISLTDHDDLRAGCSLRVMERFKDVPISIEWTVPYRQTFFHLGVHNLSPAKIGVTANELAGFTREPRPTRLKALLEAFSAEPATLVVFNHPLWDENESGAALHRTLATDFLGDCAPYIHALELNGLRTISENAEVLALAEAWRLPVVSGGDRHGREPNAILNLSRAHSFEGFVEEVRREHFSHVVFMPQYRKPMLIRILQAVRDSLRDYPENGQGRRVWSDRIFWRDPSTGVCTPFSSLWPQGPPRAFRALVSGVNLCCPR